MEMQQIERALVGLIQSYTGQLPAQQVEDMTELVQAGEPGVAFENLCTQLYEYDINVDDGVLDKLSGIGNAMGLEPENWVRLRDGA